jgi:UDP-N-acetylglucosamine:LPS N-acetylglucosamine transferase
MLESRIPIEAPRRWLTFDTPQSRSLLAGEDVTYIPHVGPRDYRGLLKNLPHASQLLRKSSTAAVVSTGSGVALAYLSVSALRGIPTCYVESATRVDGPSLTGRALAQVRGVQLFTQHESWAGEPWRYVGSVFEGFESIPRAAANTRGIRRLVVSLGTIRSYEFRRLVMRILDVVPADVEVVWQTGSTRVNDLPIEARAEMPYHELVSEMTAADAVVAHAGTGIALSAFKLGICPLLVPRRAAFNEHVDDHQMQTAKVLGDAGLAIVRQVEQLSWDDLRLAADRAVVQRSHASPFHVIRKLVPA